MPFTALITGGSRGIGFAVAKQFAKRGWNLILIARNAEVLTQSALELKQLGAVKVDVYACDLSKKVEVEQAVKWLYSQYSELNLLVNNAGVFLPGTMMEEGDEQFDFLWNANVSGVYFLTKGLWPILVKSPRAHVINMCSIASITAYAAGGTYAISKHALLGFSKSLRQEGMSVGVRVTSVLPGATLTDSWKGVDLPSERFMKPESVGAACALAFEINEDTVLEEVLLRPILGDI